MQLRLTQPQRVLNTFECVLPYKNDIFERLAFKYKKVEDFLKY